MTAPAAVRAWHEVAAARDPQRLPALLADDVVFHSPAVHAPQVGAAVTTAYLTAALAVLGPSLRYVGEWYGPDSAVLHFHADLGGVVVEGVDMLRWDEHDLLTDFTVMVRPLRGLQALIERMAAALRELG